MDAPGTPTPGPRASREKPVRAYCERCCHHISDLDQPLCNIIHDGPTQRKKCTRCARGKHACRLAEHNNIVPHLNTALHAREAAMAALGTDGDEDAARTLRTTQEALKNALKMKANYSGSFVGDTPTARKRAASSAGADGMGDVGLEELQRCRNGINAIAQAAREMVRHAGGATLNIDRALSGLPPVGDEDLDASLEDGEGA